MLETAERRRPTETLTDLSTIRTLKGHTDNMTIGLCGDLKFGRTVHSLIESLVRYKNVKFVLIFPADFAFQATSVMRY